MSTQSTQSTQVQLLTVVLTVSKQRYRQTFVAPLTPQTSLGENEVEWLKGYLLSPGFQVEGSFLSPRGDWVIEATTSQEMTGAIEYGPIGTPLRIEDIEDMEGVEGVEDNEDGQGAVSSSIDQGDDLIDE